MCKAFEDEREEGRQAGIDCINELIKCLIRDKRSDEIERVVSDKAYQGMVMMEYNLA